MWYQRWFLIICAVYYIGFLSHALYLKKTVYGDGIYYYSWLRSIVIDHDIDFINEYSYFGGNQPNTPLGLIGNKYAIGPALLWSPAFLYVHQLIKGNGYTLPYQLAVGFTSVSFTLIGLLLLWQILHTFFNNRVSILTITAIAGATNLLFYGSLDVVNSHALSFFTVTLFLYYVRMEKRHNFFIAGILLGSIGTIRMQDLIIGIVLLPYVRLNKVPKILFGLFIALTPQLIAWQILYGKFWTSPYLSNGETFNFLRPYIFEVLFSSYNGLFLYTPILIASFIGLLFWKNKLRILFLSIFLLELVVISSWSTWWQGASFSGRMFVNSLPILAFGLAHGIQRIQRQKIVRNNLLYALILPASIINILLIIFFLLRS